MSSRFNNILCIYLNFVNPVNCNGDNNNQKKKMVKDKRGTNNNFFYNLMRVLFKVSEIVDS